MFNIISDLLIVLMELKNFKKYMSLEILLVALGWSFQGLICTQAFSDVPDEHFDCILMIFKLNKIVDY